MFKTKEDVKAWYKKWFGFWVFVSLSPIVAAGIKCIIDGSINELKYGAIASVVFTILTLSGYIFNLWKAGKNE